MSQPASARPWKAIAAMARNRVIGQGGTIPWHLPDEFQWVKECTLGHTIAMGRRTFEAIGRPLPRRQNVVITRSVAALPGCVVLPSLEALAAHPAQGDVWIFGGAEIYRQALGRVHELMLTIVDLEPEGDTFFPPFEDQFRLAGIVRRTPQYEIRRYLAIEPGNEHG